MQRWQTPVAADALAGRPPAADCGTGALQPVCRCCAERQIHALEHPISGLLGLRDALHLPFEQEGLRGGAGRRGGVSSVAACRGSAISASHTEF